MKKLFTTFIAFVITIYAFTQSPQKMSYQAVIRNSGDQLVTNHSIGMKISIMQGSTTGTPVYVETQTHTTNGNGLVTIEIGSGTITTGTFAGINWAAGPYFIKTETDPSGGTSYTISGTSELLSVPYALYSANGGLAPGSDTGNTPYWNGSSWVANSSNIFNNGANIGIGTTNPSTKIDIAGGNNWDLINGEGDFRMGDNQHRLKMGVALDGGGAGGAGIMQYGHAGGYNVLSIGAQGNYLLFINGGTQRVGIGIDNPAATLDIHGTLSVVDGTQGAGKVLTSDANGAASWTASASIGAHYVGESYGGGIVFYVYDNGQHGLIAATSDQSTSMRWYASTFTNTMAYANGVGAGKANTAIIIANQGYGDGSTYAARICNEYSVTVSGVTYGDWYLPSKDELSLLYLQKAVVGGFANSAYWSSTESSSNLAWYQYFPTGGQISTIKGTTMYVRSIRAF
jgi:hypothetical protein